MLWLQFLIALATMTTGVFVLHKIDNKPSPECDIHFQDSPCEGDMDETPLAEDYNAEKQLFVKGDKNEKYTSVLCDNRNHPEFKCSNITTEHSRNDSGGR